VLCRSAAKDEGDRALGRRDEAVAAYETAARLAPRDPGPRNGLGVLSVEAGDLDRAAALFEEALAIDPRYHEARLNLAVAKCGRTSGRARAALHALLQDRPIAKRQPKQPHSCGSRGPDRFLSGHNLRKNSD